jgi:hypothetical protein
MRAVLADAVHCLLGAVRGPRRDPGRLALQARVWFTEREPTSPLGFEDVCHALDLDPHTVRRRLLALADHAAGRASARPHGLERRRRSKAERNAEMLALRRAGWSLRALADRFGVSVSRTCTICVQAERATRPAGVSASRRTARTSDVAAPPSAAGSPAPASPSARRPPFPGLAEEPPAAPVDVPPGRPRVRAER